VTVGWKAQLSLHYTHHEGRTGAHDRHEGPLRVLQRLYPEGPGICHHVIVHPPGGVVGGDELRVQARLDAGAQALITTPGATRFYRSEGAPALQQVQLRLDAGARLEWLPMETLAYSGCQARSELRMELAPGAELIGWELLVLGLPAANQPFLNGSFTQQIEFPGHWLERGRVDASDRCLLQGPLGWAGSAVLGTAWFATGTAMSPKQRDELLACAREGVQGDPLAVRAGITAPQARVVVLRVLASGVEPAMQLMQRVRAAWRLAAWGLGAEPPRIWRT
jgi:urease accessory protein